MRLLGFEVRQDWREFENQITAEFARTWRLITLTVFISAAIAFALSLLALSQPYDGFLQILFNSVIFFSLVLWTIFRPVQNGRQLTIIATLLLCACAWIAASTIPQDFDLHTFSSELARWPLALGLTIPLLTSLLLLWVCKKFPIPMMGLGIWPERWKSNVLTGLLAGAALGVHLFFTTHFLSLPAKPWSPDLNSMLWFLFYLAGLWVFSSELLLRGLGFFCIYEQMQNTFLASALKLAMLDVVMITPLVLHVTGLYWGVWFLLYRFFFSILATFLRFRQGSTLASISCNLAFSLIMIVVMV